MINTVALSIADLCCSAQTTNTLASFDWLHAAEWIKFKLAVIVYQAIHGTVPWYFLIGWAMWLTCYLRVDYSHQRLTSLLSVCRVLLQLVNNHLLLLAQSCGTVFQTTSRLGATYNVHLRLIGKVRSGLPISVNWTFLIGATAEALRGNMEWKSAISLQRGQLGPKFQVEGVAPYQPFFFSES